MPAVVYVCTPGIPSTWFHFTGYSNRCADGDKRHIVIGTGIIDTEIPSETDDGSMKPRVIAETSEGRYVVKKVLSEKIVNNDTKDYDETECCRIA